MAPDGPRLPRRYGALRLLARGGMAEVYRGTDDVLERDVAVKILSELHADDAELRARFTREAQTAARLSAEPTIVTIFDVGEVDGRPYIVMELLDGGSVADRLHDGPVAAALALAWLDQAARGLDVAHARGVVHRDVKPANLLLTSEGDLRVTDFGIARAAGDSSLTLTGTIMGTRGYMSPEQARGGRATEASDRYGLAIVAFELLTGRRPFAAETPAAEAEAHANAPVPRASAFNPALPPAVDEVFARGLAKEPEDRPASCGELVDALRDAVRAETDTTWPAVAAPPHITHVRRRRTGVAGLALGLVALALLGAGALAASLLAGWGDEGSREAVTVVRTQTAQGRERRTVTVQRPATAQAAAQSGASAAELNDEGYRLMGEGDFREALPLLEAAVDKLRGSGSIVEAYASYNLAFTRLRLGACQDVRTLLDRSEDVQGFRVEIARLRLDATRACGN